MSAAEPDLRRLLTLLEAARREGIAAVRYGNIWGDWSPGYDADADMVEDVGNLLRDVPRLGGAQVGRHSAYSRAGSAGSG